MCTHTLGIFYSKHVMPMQAVIPALTNGCAVRPSDQDLGRAVPARNNVLREGSSFGRARARKAKITQLHHAVLGQQNVGGLKVTVDDLHVGVARS